MTSFLLLSIDVLAFIIFWQFVRMVVYLHLCAVAVSRLTTNRCDICYIIDPTDTTNKVFGVDYFFLLL